MKNTSPKQRKEKVNFNIESDTLHRIKRVTDERGMLLSDFFRQASEEKLRKEEKFMTIYVMMGSVGIKRITIERDLYTITLKDASKSMQTNVGALQEGTLELLSEGKWAEYQNEELNQDEDDLIPILDYSIYIDSNLEKLFADQDVIYFFTKISY